MGDIDITAIDFGNRRNGRAVFTVLIKLGIPLKRGNIGITDNITDLIGVPELVTHDDLAPSVGNNQDIFCFYRSAVIGERH